MFNLEGKRALVTGATGGIGEAIVQTLHAQGAEIILSGRNEEKLANAVKNLGERAIAKQCDLADKTQAKELIPYCEKNIGAVDILIHNAGITKDNLLLRMSDDDWENVLDVNLSSAFYLCKPAFRAMMKRKYGRIINITSVVGATGNPGQANYVSAKSGLFGFTKVLAAEGAKKGITANTVAPGFIKTPMTDVLTDEQKEHITRNIPVGKIGSPENIAHTVLFLASLESSYITGQTIHVNGGMHMA